MLKTGNFEIPFKTAGFFYDVTGHPLLQWLSC